MTAEQEWGRVDDAGTVWVRVGDGEREVGSYPGATPDEALAYFGRKFDELNGQIRLLEQRLSGPGLPAGEALAGVDRLRTAVAQARAVGDLATLAARVEALAPRVAERKAAQDAERAEARAAERSAKEALVVEAETLSTSTAWKASGERLRLLVDEWKAAPRLERPVDDVLWKRFSAARNAFDRARRQHFAALDAQRGEARSAKTKLVTDAEALAGSTDWGPTAAAFRDLMTAWKAAPRGGKAEEDALWQRFRAAQDAFFAARSATFDERDAEQRTNLAAKQELVVEAEALLPVTDAAAARRALRGIQERWEGIGHVPIKARPALEARLQAVEEAARAHEETRWRRTNPEARARAEAAVAQLETAIAKLGRTAETARERGDQRAAAEAQASLAARQEWLVEARRVLSENAG